MRVLVYTLASTGVLNVAVPALSQNRGMASIGACCRP
jgi:hypothetical protein